ncbi:hypothetical protein DL766_003809 [Monosporascus sp. MC13-8B]|uniref:Histone H4 n=1 Tax=Monosporascus cannonballus TaxID=155416 RepID=A0ABY0GS27_9PEZI|nr:hypothetical protein DL762_009919 [Monosporascus cannonballus]RYO81641.1 hypothetical protein DL763_008520 [Monosporascus cannonballus]RYP32836.1 hypothetical protein DL766_003809 [Monosporascus sp. MC13-8B]
MPSGKSIGRAPSGKGLGGKHGAKRHRKILRDNINGITKPAIRRLARRGGVKRISGNIYEEIRSVLKARLELVLFSLRRLGRPIYGFDDTNGQTSRVNRANRPSGTSQ